MTLEQDHLLNDEGRLAETTSKNISISMLCTFLQLVTRFFIPPIVLLYVPLEVYGIWAYCFIFISYFGMSTIGISNVYVRYVAIYFAHQDFSKINRLLSTGLILSTTVCVIGLAVLWFLIPLTFSILQIPESLTAMAFILIFGTVATFTIELTLGAFNYLLHGLHKVGLQRIFVTIVSCLESLLIVAFLYSGFGIYSLLYAFAIKTVLLTAMSAVACYRFLPSLSLQLRYFDCSLLKTFFSFGGVIQLRSAVGMFNRSMEKLLAGIFLGTWATALYDLGVKFPLSVISMPKMANAVFLPANSHFHAKGEQENIQLFYLSGTRFIHLFTSFFLAFLACFSSYLITAWLGQEEKYQVAALILSCFAIPYQIEVVTGPASVMFRSIKRPGIELAYGISELVIVLTTAAIMFFFFSPTVLAINISVGGGMTVASLTYLLYTNRFLKIPQRVFFRDVFAPAFLPYAIAFTLFLCVAFIYPMSTVTRLEALVIFLVAGAFYSVVTLAVLVKYVLYQKEKDHLKRVYFKKETR